MRPPSDAPLTCAHFGSCGGCSSLDRPIAEQLARKQARAHELLRPFLAGRTLEYDLPPRTPRHDRCSILYPAQRRGFDLELGIYRRGTHDVEPITDCRIQHKALTRLAVAAGAAMRELGLHAYDEASQRGLVRGFRARVMPGSNELLVGAITRQADFSERPLLGARLADLASELRDDQGRPLRLVGVCLNVNDRPGNALLGATTIALRGAAFQTDLAAGLRFRVSFASFYQQSRHSDAILFRPALAMLGDVKGLRVVDGYGGVGTFALRLLRAGAEHATIVESSRDAAADLRHNLAANDLANAEVREEPFGATTLPPCDLVVVDPPRAGLMATGTNAILAAAPPRVLLVSCSLESLARDLAQLDASYRTVAARLCDLFPHTEHVESLLLLERR